MTSKALISLELNEIKFDYVAKYSQQGLLPTFSRILSDCEVFRTRAETKYRELEPWIQWPSFYSGKSYSEHGVFRLGDITRTAHEQIWETLEKKQLTVGAISPMNASNRCSNAAFFVPDPWTETSVTGGWAVRKLYASIRDIVNENKTGKASLISMIWFGLLGVVLARRKSIPVYLKMIRLRLKGQEWALAALLDRLLADVFIRLYSSRSPEFSSLFLNAGAHIQHHHMYESSCYSGEHRNPDWYSTAGKQGIDPLLTIYQVYDGILADFLNLSDARILVSTALSQIPNERPIHQYRFREHESFLNGIGLGGFEVAPRMSRDFTVRLHDPNTSSDVRKKMEQVQVDAQPFFEIDERAPGDFFCKIAYNGPPDGLRRVSVKGKDMDISESVALVSIENGIHSTIGYHIDTDIPARTSAGNLTDETIPLTSIFAKIVAAATALKSGRNENDLPAQTT